MSVLDVYKEVLDDKPSIFDLTNDLTTFVCKNDRANTVSNVSHVTRTCKHIITENDKNVIN